MQIPWLFPDFSQYSFFHDLQQNSLTFPWLLPSVEFPWLFPDCWTPCRMYYQEYTLSYYSYTLQKAVFYLGNLTISKCEFMKNGAAYFKQNMYNIFSASKFWFTCLFRVIPSACEIYWPWLGEIQQSKTISQKICIFLNLCTSHYLQNPFPGIIFIIISKETACNCYDSLNPLLRIHSSLAVA